MVGADIILMPTDRSPRQEFIFRTRSIPLIWLISVTPSL
jgi:hypothetical protein